MIRRVRYLAWWSAAILLLGSLPLSAAIAPAPSAPSFPSHSLTRLEVLAWMSMGAASLRAEQLIARAGIAFAPDAATLAAFRAAGAPPDLIAAITKAGAKLSVSTPAAPDSGQDASVFAHFAACIARARANSNVAPPHAPETVTGCDQASRFEPAVTQKLMGGLDLALGRPLQAAAAFTRAIQADGSIPDDHFSLGATLMELGQVAGAETQLKEAIRLDPAYEAPHAALAVLALRRNDQVTAEREARAAVAAAPNDATAYPLLAAVLASRGDLDDALANDRAALKLDPKEPDAWANQGQIMGARGDWAGAAAALRRALALAPRNWMGHLQLAAALDRLGKPSEALGECQAAANLNADPRVAALCGKLAAKVGVTANGGATQQTNFMMAGALRHDPPDAVPDAYAGATSVLAKRVKNMSPADFTAALASAAAGDATAETVACLANRGLRPGTAPDPVQARAWCQKAAAQNNVVAEEQLGMLLMRDAPDAPANPAAAVASLTRAATSGDLLAMDDLGTFYADGLAGPPDFARALAWYQLAADAGYAPADVDLGIMYLAGTGVARDPARGFDFLKTAEKHGVPSADTILGLAAMNGMGGGVDMKSAVKYLQRAAKAGEVRAQTELGWLYAHGQGVGLDYKTAVYWLAAASRQGDSEAEYSLASRYLMGQGVPQSAARAAYWLKLAADQGHANAAYDLGIFYLGRLQGQAPTAPDYPHAVQYLTVSAEQGISDGQCLLGELIAAGQGAPRDPVAAWRWMTLGVHYGSDQCSIPVRQLEAGMTASQVSEAKAQTAAWESAHAPNPSPGQPRTP